MRTIVIGVASAVVCLLGASGTAAAAPEWCKGATESFTASERDLKDLPSNNDADDAVETIVAQSCYPDADYAKYDKNVESAYKEWS